MTTLSAKIICFNENLWLSHCVMSLYDHVDEIVVVEGSVRLVREAGGVKTQHAQDAIDRLPDPERKIKFFPDNQFEDKKEMRQFALENCSSDWVLLVDADEFYLESHLTYIRHTIDCAGSEVRLVVFPHLGFLDFGTIIGTGQFERLYRRDGAHYGGRVEEGQNIYVEGWGKLWSALDPARGGQDMVLRRPKIRCLHYSKMKGRDSLYVRSRYYMNRIAKREGVGPPEEVVNNRDRALDRVWTAPPGTRGVFDRRKFSSYPVEEHPETVKRHPLYKKYLQLLQQGREKEFVSFVLDHANEVASAILGEPWTF